LLVDTLRADHLSLYGYERPTSPNLDQFARSAIVFEKVMAAAPWTLPSVASVMTGAYPSVHGLRATLSADKVTALRPEVTTLAEQFAGQGYRTVAIITNPWVITERFGLARGFEEYIPLIRENAPAVHELAREVIVRDDPRPLFLYLHYMDPHGPYNRHPDTDPTGLGPLPARLQRKLTPKENRSLPNYLRLPGKQDLGSYIQAYDRAIYGWDESFGAWIRWLDARNPNPAPVVAVIADHGEEFTERGSWSHGTTLYEEQLSVPWLLRLPDRSPTRVSDRVVSLIDVAPTLLAALGMPIAETMMGSDVLSDAFPLDRAVFSETEIRLGGIVDSRFFQRAVRRGDEKYIQRPSGPECYELASDPFERSPDCGATSWRDRARADIERWDRENKTLASTLGSSDSLELDPELLEHLRAIGYAQ
jgi:arylsulfatase A-like enzyme